MPDWIQNIDDGVLRFFLDHHVKVLDKSVLDATALGSTTLLALVVLFTLGVLLLHRQYRRAIVAAVVAGIYFTTDFLKSAVDRTRPAIGKGIIPTPHSPSFPSSHASLSMAIFLIAAMCMGNERNGIIFHEHAAFLVDRQGGTGPHARAVPRPLLPFPRGRQLPSCLL